MVPIPFFLLKALTWEEFNKYFKKALGYKYTCINMFLHLSIIIHNHLGGTVH